MTKTHYVVKTVQERLGSECELTKDAYRQAFVLKYRGNVFTVNNTEYEYTEHSAGYFVDEIIRHLTVKQRVYEFIGPYKRFGVSLANLMRKKPCSIAIKQAVDELLKRGYVMYYVFTDIDEFLGLQTVRDNLQWLISNRVIAEAEVREMCPWDKSAELKKNRHGEHWTVEEKSWVREQFYDVVPKGQIDEIIQKLAKKTHRTEHSIAYFIRDYCIR